MGRITLVKKRSSETPRSESMALGYAIGSGSFAERPEMREERVQVLGDEAGVFEVAEEPEIADQADHEPERARPPAPFHQEDHEVVDRRGAEEQQEVPGIPPAVERVRGDHQPDVHQLVVSADEKVDGVDDQEEDEEDPGVEEHGCLERMKDEA